MTAGSSRLMNRLLIPLVVLAAILTLYSTASLLTGFESDFEVSAVAAVLALGCVIWIQWRADERAWREAADSDPLDRPLKYDRRRL